MPEAILTYLVTFAVGFGLSLGLTPLLLKLIRIRGPYDRTCYGRRLPTLGGLGIIVATFMAGVSPLVLGGSPGVPPQLLPLVIASIPIIGVSIYDDIKGASVGLRLGCQALGGLTFSLWVGPLQRLNLPWGVISLGVWAHLVVILWLMLTANAINFLDGLDGLAAGIAAIAGVVLFGSALIARSSGAAILALAAVGAPLGFLLYNFHPARIFMGDTGSVFLGFLLGVVALIGAGKSVAMVSLALPVMALGIPILDAISAVIRRTHQGRSPFKGDRGHIHHRLLSMGIPHARVVIYLYIISALFGLLGLSLFYENRAIPILILLLGLVVGYIFLRR